MSDPDDQNAEPSPLLDRPEAQAMGASTSGPSIERAVTRGVLVAAALVIAGLLFRQLITLALALLLSVIFAILLDAVATYFERFRIPRSIGALAGVVAAVLFWAGVLILIIPPFSHEVQLLAHNAPSLIDSAESRIHQLTGLSTATIGHQAQAALQRVVADPTSLLGTVASVGRGVAVTLGGLVLVTLAAYYMAVRPQPLIGGILRLVPPPRRSQAKRVLVRLHDAWLGWFRGLFLEMLLTGTLTYLALMAIGLQYALVLAVVTAVLLVVPFFGAIASGIPAVALGLTVSPGKALVVLLVYIGIHQIDGNVIGPLVMGASVRMHPALLAFGVVIIGALFGPIGLIVSVPLLSLASVLIEELWMNPLEGNAAKTEASSPPPK